MKIGYVVEAFDKEGNSLGLLGKNEETVSLFTNEKAAKMAIEKLDSELYTGKMKAIAMFEVEEDYGD